MDTRFKKGIIPWNKKVKLEKICKWQSILRKTKSR